MSYLACVLKYNIVRCESFYLDTVFPSEFSCCYFSKCLNFPWGLATFLIMLWVYIVVVVICSVLDPQTHPGCPSLYPQTCLMCWTTFFCHITTTFSKQSYPEFVTYLHIRIWYGFQLLLFLSKVLLHIISQPLRVSSLLSQLSQQLKL